MSKHAIERLPKISKKLFLGFKQEMDWNYVGVDAMQCGPITWIFFYLNFLRVAKHFGIDNKPESGLQIAVLI